MVMEQLLADIPTLVLQIDNILFAWETLTENFFFIYFYFFKKNIYNKVQKNIGTVFKA